MFVLRRRLATRVIVDGAVRDVAGFEMLGLPVYAVGRRTAERASVQLREAELAAAPSAASVTA